MPIRLNLSNLSSRVGAPPEYSSRQIRYFSITWKPSKNFLSGFCAGGKWWELYRTLLTFILVYFYGHFLARYLSINERN